MQEARSRYAPALIYACSICIVYILCCYCTYCMKVNSYVTTNYVVDLLSNVYTIIIEFVNDPSHLPSGR